MVILCIRGGGIIEGGESGMFFSPAHPSHAWYVCPAVRFLIVFPCMHIGYLCHVIIVLLGKARTYDRQQHCAMHNDIMHTILPRPSWRSLAIFAPALAVSVFRSRIRW